MKSYEDLIYKLKECQDEKYLEFITNGKESIKDNTIGIRVPILREIAKDLANDNYNIIKSFKYKYSEEEFLEGLIIGYLKDYDLQLNLIKEFVPKLTNWGSCDSFCSTLRNSVKKHNNDFWNLIKEYITTNKEFQVRFAFVMMLDYFLDEEHIDEILKYCNDIKSNAYYINMAKAWLIATAFSKIENDKMFKYMKESELDNWTYNKAIQKAIESFRVSEDTKNKLKLMKR